MTWAKITTENLFRGFTVVGGAGRKMEALMLRSGLQIVTESYN